MSDNFLARWSRRKLSQDDERAAAEAPLPPLPVADEPAPAAEPAPDPDAITPEELAALPPVESIVSADALTAFLRKGVPVALRNAALRRMWVLDPAIRDFVGDARDYAWDWNTPGGVPCTGPLDPATDVQAMVRKIMGGKDEAAESMRENVIAAPEPPPQPVAPPPRAAPRPPVVAETAELPQIPEEDARTDADDPPVRRHGGALPA